jgi:hypothetical protein
MNKNNIYTMDNPIEIFSRNVFRAPATNDTSQLVPLTTPAKDPTVKLHEEARKALSRDMWSSKVLYWPLIEQDGKTPVDANVEQQPLFCDLTTEFPFLNLIFSKYKGEICAAGGAVANHLFMRSQFGPASLDVDLFFYGISEDRANVILKDCVAMLCCATDYIGYEDDKLKVLNKRYYRQVRVERNMKYVNVSFTTVKRTINRRGDPEIIQDYRIYQFVLRIYPTFDSVIGGFDIPASSFAYDGDKYWGTEIADWCMTNQTLIANIKRRSPSFEHRLIKYCRRFNLTLFFPGLDKEKMFALTTRADFSKLKADIIEIVKRNGFGLRDFDGENFTDDSWFESNFNESVRCMDWPIFHRIVFPRGEAHPPMMSGRWNENLANMSKEEVERISDYSHTNAGNHNIRALNSSSCIANNPDAVIVCMVYTESPTYSDVSRALNDMIDDPKITTLDGVFLESKCSNLVERITAYNRKQRTEKLIKTFGFGNINAEFGSFNAFQQACGKNFERITKMCETRMHRNHKNSLATATRNLKGLRWITKNPSVQWTSSHHPIHANAAEYYLDWHRRFEVGIPWEITKVMLLGFQQKTSILWTLRIDMFKYLMLHLLRAYSI